MNDEIPAATGESWIPYLVRKRKFAECIILAWQSVEDMVDQMTVQGFGLLFFPEKEDPRVDVIRDEVRFPAKLRFLKNMGRISEKDYTAIQEFSKERNRLFHGNVFTSRHPVVISKEEKTRLMDLAKNVSQITTNRCLGVWSDEGTGDLGNKGLPKPDLPRSVKMNRAATDLLEKQTG